MDMDQAEAWGPYQPALRKAPGQPMDQEQQIKKRTWRYVPGYPVSVSAPTRTGTGPSAQDGIRTATPNSAGPTEEALGAAEPEAAVEKSTEVAEEGVMTTSGSYGQPVFIKREAFGAEPLL